MVTSDVLKTFGAQLRAARSAAGWTLAQLAEEAFGNPDRKGYVSQIEHGRKPITALTVGKLAEALDLPDSVTGPMYANDAPTEETFDETDERAEALLTTAEREGSGGVAEALMIGLAYDYAEGDTPDLDTAYRGLRAALETAREMKERAALPDNIDAGISAVRAEVQRLNEGDEREAAREAITEAMAKKTAEMSALLDLGVQQDRILNDPVAAAEKLVEQARLERKASFADLRDLQDVWDGRAQRQGLVFDAHVAIHIAEHVISVARTADERGAALNDLGIALKNQGAQEIGTQKLEDAITAFRAVLKETSNGVNRSFAAMVCNNLGTALRMLGFRTDNSELLHEAVDTYRAALDLLDEDSQPSEWAMVQNNVGVAMQYSGERTGSIDQLKTAKKAYRAALRIRTQSSMFDEWAMTTCNLGNTLRIIGELTGSRRALKESVSNFRQVLKLTDAKLRPLDWASRQNYLGNSLVALGTNEVDVDRLFEARSAFEKALTIYSMENSPLNWGGVRMNQAILERTVFHMTGETESLENAHVFAKIALSVFERTNSTSILASIENLLKEIQALKGPS